MHNRIFFSNRCLSSKEYPMPVISKAMLYSVGSLVLLLGLAGQTFTQEVPRGR